MAMIEVLIDGTSEVYQGESREVAGKYYDLYCEYSRSRIGRAAGKEISMRVDDRTIASFDPRTHEGYTLWDRLDYWWFNWGNDICKALFALIVVLYAFVALYLWGPLIKSGLGSYLGG